MQIHVRQAVPPEVQGALPQVVGDHYDDMYNCNIITYTCIHYICIIDMYMLYIKHVYIINV